jgi:hypothetical protein
MQFGQTLGGRFGPDSFSTLQRCLKEEAKTLSLKAALAIVSYHVQLTLHPDALFVTALTMVALLAGFTAHNQLRLKRCAHVL